MLRGLVHDLLQWPSSFAKLTKQATQGMMEGIFGGGRNSKQQVSGTEVDIAERKRFVGAKCGQR
jgi:hypothetical protein